MDECGEGSIRAIHKWKKGTVETRVQICWLTTAGLWETLIDEYKRQEKVKCVFADEFFVVTIPYKDTLFII
jgi:homoserine trans-succinylase